MMIHTQRPSLHSSSSSLFVITVKVISIIVVIIHIIQVPSSWETSSQHESSSPSALQIIQWWDDNKQQDNNNKNNNNNNNNNNNLQRDNKPWKKIRNSTQYTGYRYVNKLIKCVPNKVSSSANRDIYAEWKKLPVANTTTTTTTTFSYAVIRDPLSRLFSGYWNKCLHSGQDESHCIHFSTAHERSKTQQPPPTFLQFLQYNYIQDNFRKMHRNSHYKPIVKLCRHIQKNNKNQDDPKQTKLSLSSSSYDYVFDMADAQFNIDMNDFWKRLGAPHKMVNSFFPTTRKRKLSWYHSGSIQTDTVKNFYLTNNTDICQTLQLAIMATSTDYDVAPQYFPKPQWALDAIKDCPPLEDSIVFDTFDYDDNVTSPSDSQQMNPNNINNIDEKKATRKIFRKPIVEEKKELRIHSDVMT